MLCIYTNTLTLTLTLSTYFLQTFGEQWAVDVKMLSALQFALAQKNWFCGYTVVIFVNCIFGIRQ